MSFIFQNGKKISYFENRQSKIESTIFMDLGNNCKQVHTLKNLVGLRRFFMKC